MGAYAADVASSSGSRSLEGSRKGDLPGQRLHKLYMDGPIWLQWPILLVWCATLPHAVKPLIAKKGNACHLNNLGPSLELDRFQQSLCACREAETTNVQHSMPQALGRVEALLQPCAAHPSRVEESLYVCMHMQLHTAFGCLLHTPAGRCSCRQVIVQVVSLHA